MKQSIFISALALFLLFGLNSHAQSMDFLDFTRVKPYRNCAAIVFKGKVLGDEYFIENKPKIGFGMLGTITVATVSISKEGSTPIDQIKFQVAIKNKRTNTMWIYTKEAVSELDLEELLKMCEPDDRLIFMPVDQQYSLSQYEMSVMGGC